MRCDCYLSQENLKERGRGAQFIKFSQWEPQRPDRRGPRRYPVVTAASRRFRRTGAAEMQLLR